MQFQMNNPNSPMFYNKSELRLKRCGDSVHYIIFTSYCFIYFLRNCWAADFYFSLPHHWRSLFEDISVSSSSYYLLELFSLHSTITLSSFINPVNGSWKKATGIFWKVLQKPGSVFTGWERAGLRDVEPAVFYNVVLSVTWQLTAVRLSKQSCYIFHLKNPRGHQCVWLCWLKPDGGFPINKCTGSIYTDCGTWRHNTHDTLFSGQSCHKSLERIK